MFYLIILAVLFFLEVIYFKIADHFNIIDKPNLRSSHSTITLRGGGIIFAISLFVYFYNSHFNYPFFMLGLAAISAISFADDVKPRPSGLRIFIHFIAVALIIYQWKEMGISQLPFALMAIAFVLVLGTLNAYNFMDGINGITSVYSFTILVALFYINQQQQVFQPDVIIYLTLGNLVFFFFNFRNKAKCFAGDVGSISMAFALLFFAGGMAFKTGTLIYILLFAVYGVDSVFTIIHRIIKRENIFEAHRQHLFQYLANEKKWPHLQVSFLYAALQIIISIGVCLMYKRDLITQLIFAIIVLISLIVPYLFFKQKILKANNEAK